jgi:hypothetical protein
MGAVDFEIWLQHFEHHARHPHLLPCGLEGRLTPDERRHIAGSMATFQLGEQSEGNALLKAAREFAGDRSTSPALVRVIELLIREEQRHAALLLAYMEDHQIAPKRRDWTERLFRRIRRLAGLELYLHVLISAELIGIVYYRALGSATTCPRLMALCRVLVSDELAHVGFESQLLLSLRRRLSAPSQAVIRAAHRAFFAGTAVVVWASHRELLRRAGHSGRGFLRASLSEYAFYLGQVNPSGARPDSFPVPNDYAGIGRTMEGDRS